MRAQRLGSLMAALGGFFIFIISLFGSAMANAADFASSAGELTAASLPTMAKHAPANVPLGYVVTPFGYFHPSCVRVIGERSVLQADGSVKEADGSVTRASACRYPHYTKEGVRLDGNALPSHPMMQSRSAKAPDVNGWLEASWYTNSAPYGGMSAKWLVPSGPATNVGQVLYFFPGLEDAENVQTILQPVLGWNGFNDSAWTIASWNCCQGGNADHSNPVSVSTGDQIVGAIRGDCAAGSVCSTWDIVTTDNNTAQRTLLKQSSSYGQTFDWVMAGVVEVYGVSSCDHYPSNGFVDFTNVVVQDINKQNTSVPWQSSGLMPSDPPACNYGVNVAPTSASLTF